MMTPRTRRDFLADVGRGMLVAGVGLGTAVDLGLASASAGEVSGPVATITLSQSAGGRPAISPRSLIPPTLTRRSFG